MLITIPDIPGQAWAQGGFFVLLLIIICAVISLVWVAVRSLRWLGCTVLLPSRDRFFRHLDTIEEKVGATAPAINGLTEAINKACKFDPDRHCKHQE